MERFSDISEHPKLAELDNVIQRRRLLSAQIEADQFVDENIKNQFVQAHAQAQHEIGEMLEDPEVAEQLSQIKQNAEAAINQLETLSSITGEQPDREAVEEYRDRLAKAGALLAKDVVDQTVELPVFEPADESEDIGEITDLEEDYEKEALLEKVPVALTVTDRSVQIGEQGRKVMFDKSIRSDHKNYGAHRKAGLLYMVGRQGENVSVTDLRAAIQAATGEADENMSAVINQFRAWFKKDLNFGQSPLIIREGGRGLSSTYRTSDDFTLSVKIAEAQPETDDTKITAEDTVTEGVSEMMLTHEDSGEDSLGLRDMKFVAMSLKNHTMRHAMRDLEIPQMSLGLIDEISDAAKNASLVGATDRSQLPQERKLAWERLETVLNDEEKLFDMIDQVEQGSPEERFLSYLMDLSGQNKEFMPKLLSARAVRMDGETTFRDCETNALIWDEAQSPSVYVEEDENELLEEEAVQGPITEELDLAELEGEVESEEDEAADLESEASVEDTEKEAELNEGEVISLGEHRHKKSLKEKTKEVRDETFEKIKNELEDFVGFLCESMGLNEKDLLSRRQVLKLFNINDSALDKLVASGRLSVKENDKQPQFTIQDLITIKAHSVTKNSKYTILERKGGGAKLVRNFIGELSNNFAERKTARKQR